MVQCIIRNYSIKILSNITVCYREGTDFHTASLYLFTPSVKNTPKVPSQSILYNKSIKQWPAIKNWFIYIAIQKGDR